MTEIIDFDFDSGDLSLDFANTVDWHASDKPRELLNSYLDLLKWAESASIIAPDRANLLRKASKDQPEIADNAYGRAIEVRDAIYRLFSDAAGNNQVSDADLRQLNETLEEASCHMQLVQVGKEFQWEWKKEALDLYEVLWPVVRAAGQLLVSDNLGRVKECADDRGCGFLFLDTSRNRSRRWCSMKSCGNRAKVMRHYHRQQSAESS